MLKIFRRDTNKNNESQDSSTKNKQSSKIDKKKLKEENKKDKEQGIQFKPMDNRGLFIDETPFSFSSSFIEKNGRVGAILKLNIDDGSNRKLNFLDVLSFIPQSTMEDVELHLLVRDKVIKNDEKRKLIKNKVRISKAGIVDRQEQQSKKTSVDQDDASTVEKQNAKLEDYEDYENILDTTVPVSVYDIRLLVTADSEESLDDQIEVLNTLFNTNFSGAQWVSDPGEQRKNFEELFSEINEDVTSFTATGREYAGFNLSVNAGLHDPEGVPLGQDYLSLTGSSSYINFDESLHKQAIISTPRTSYNSLYFLRDTEEHATLSSLLSQAAANDSVMRGKRAHHIVLNDFDYFDERYGYRFNGMNLEDKDEFDKLFKVYNASDQTINPLQGFGEYQRYDPNADSIENIYSRLKNKVVNIFDVLLDFELDHKGKVFLNEQLDNFYKSRSYWNTDSPKRPLNSQIIKIKNPERYSVLSDFQTFLGTQARATASNQNLQETYKLLENTVKTAISTNGKILNRTTDIEESHALQTYYDFGNIDDPAYKQVQLLNMFDYIMYTAKPQDVVVIHGFNEVVEEVFHMLVPSIKAAQRRGVRFIFSYDVISGPMKDKEFKYNDMFTSQHSLYSDLSSEVDYFILGTMLPQEVNALENKYLNQNLGTTVRSKLVERLQTKFLIHRSSDSTNNFIISMFII